MQRATKINKSTLFTILLVFFIGDNVLTKFNIPLQIHKFILLTMCCFAFVKIFDIGFKRFPQAIRLLFFMILYTLLKIYLYGSTGNTNMGIIAILPVIIFLTFISTVNTKELYMYKKILYYAYIIECGIAIIEKILNINVFQLAIGTEVVSTFEFSSTDFRSIGLYGHPLQNALIVFCFITFILIYENNIKLKFGLSLLGIIAIFCFNSRAAIVMSSSCFIVYIFYWIKTYRISGVIKISTFSFVLIVCIIFFKLYSSGIIGGRLSSMGLYDDQSAAVRVELLSIFNYYDLNNFILGISNNELEILKYKTGILAIENFWFNWLFSYGIIFVCGVLLFYIQLIRKIFRNEKKFHKFFLIIPFIILASTNPSLAVSIVPMSSFLLLSYIMPKSIQRKEL